MSTTSTRIVHRRYALVAFPAAVVMTAVLSGAAHAAQPTPADSGARAVAAYAAPLDSLGGRSLGQYLADLRLDDPRLRLV